MTRAPVDERDDLDPGGDRTWGYRPISAGARLLWLHRLREYGPRHDFRYHNDDPFTEELRARYNALVTDPALRSEPEVFPIEDLPGYAYGEDD
jgi:hypothetical protein